MQVIMHHDKSRTPLTLREHQTLTIEGSSPLRLRFVKYPTHPARDTLRNDERPKSGGRAISSPASDDCACVLVKQIRLPFRKGKGSWIELDWMSLGGA